MASNWTENILKVYKETTAQAPISHLAAGDLVLLDPLGEEAGRVLGLDAGRHDDGAALPPVHRGGNLPPGSQLQPSLAL